GGGPWPLPCPADRRRTSRSLRELVGLVAPDGPARARSAGEQLQPRPGAVAFDAGVDLAGLSAVLLTRGSDDLMDVLGQPLRAAPAAEQDQFSVLARRVAHAGEQIPA